MALSHLKAITAAAVLLASPAGCERSSTSSPAAGLRPAPRPAPAPQPHRRSAVAQTGDWPLFRGNPAGTGVAESDLPKQLDLLWQYKLGDTAFVATPIVVGDTVYVGDGDRAFHAFDLATGKPRWTFPAEHGFIAAAAYRDGQIYVGGADGIFHCLDAKTGHERWKYTSRLEINSSANFYEDSVLFGSQDGSLYRLRCDDGTLVWKFSIDLKEGEEGIQSSPTLAGSRVFFSGCDGKLHVIDLATKKELPGLDLGDPTMSSPAVVGEFAYFGTESGDFLAVQWRTPRVIWFDRNPHSGSEVRTSAAVTKDLVLIAGRSRSVAALGRADGKPVWLIAADGRVDASPVVAGSRVFFGTTNGRLGAVDLATGRPAWKYNAGGGFSAAPAVARGRLVVGNNNGVLYCFGSKDEN